MYKTVLAVIGLAILLPASTAGAASFRCRGPLNRTEAAICNNAALSAKDSQMARIYGNLWRVSSAFSRRSLLSSQTYWLRQRNACGGNPGCLMRTYTSRIFVLNRFAGN